MYFRSDSVAWNLHKMTGAGIQCSAFVVKDKVHFVRHERSRIPLTTIILVKEYVQFLKRLFHITRFGTADA